MPDHYVVTRELIPQLALDLRDDAGVLAEFAARLTPSREGLIDAWCAADPRRRAWYEQGVDVFLSALQPQGNGHILEGYLNGVARWGRSLAASMNFGEASKQFTDLRACALPYLLQAYPAGPELELAFEALDDLERAVRTLIGAVYVDANQKQLSETARLRMLGELTPGLVHSLNNLLTRILGRAQLLDQLVADEHARNELRDIELAAHDAAENLRRVQEYAASHDEFLGPTDLNAAVGDAVQLTRYRWRDEAEANGIVIDVIQDLGDIPPVLGNRGELRDALVELILNSVEAMPRGGLVTLRTERRGENVLATVGDLGEGMDAATRAAGLKPFFTTKGEKHIGLGLSTVAAIVQGHQGRLDIVSAPGRGTMVSIALPIAAAKPTTEPATPQVASRSLRILVVDDDVSILETTGKALSIRGHQVTTAESGFEAQRVVGESGSFDAVLCDLGMPGMNGIEVAHWLNQNQPGLIVILMTGWLAELDANQVQESGIYRAVNKPFDVEHVLQLIVEAEHRR